MGNSIRINMLHPQIAKLFSLCKYRFAAGVANVIATRMLQCCTVQNIVFIRVTFNQIILHCMRVHYACTSIQVHVGLNVATCTGLFKQSFFMHAQDISS